MKYDIKQFRYCKSNQTFYSDVKSLATKKKHRKKFSKKKFVIVNNKTNVGYEFVHLREYYNAYKFVTKSKFKKNKLFVVIFKPGLNKKDRKDLSPVKHLNIYPTDKATIYKVCMPYKSTEIQMKYGFCTRMKKINMQDVYTRIGVKRYVDLSVQNFIDMNISYVIFLLILKDKELIKKSHYKALMNKGKDCPTFLLKKKYTIQVWGNSYYKRMFSPLVRFCPISKMELKKGTFNNIKYNFNY